MLFRQYPQVLLTSFLIVGLTDRASIAFNIIPPNPGATRFYRPESIYQIDKNREGRTEIDMGLWSQPLPHGGTPTFKSALSLWSLKSEQGRSGWSFNAAAEDLKGSFEVITYQACGLKDGCGGASTPISDINPPYRGVGSLFHLKYHPGKGDPQPGEGKLHWIQMVQANYGRGLPGVPLISGVPFIDNFNRKQNPYYDRPNSRFAGEDFFMDQPYNDVASRNNYFKAQLYLVQETTPPKSKKRTITIYNGIKWGWKNTVTRRKEPVPVPVPKPTPTPSPKPFPFIIPIIPDFDLPPIRIPKGEPVASSASGGGGIGYVTASPSPTPRPTPSPLPTPRPAPRPSPSPTPSPIILVSPAPSPLPAPSPGPAPVPSAWTPSRTPTPSAWTSSPWPTPAPWATTPTPSPRLTSSPLPTPSPWTPSPWPTPTPWVTSPLGSTSSTVVVSTSTTTTKTTTSPSSFQRPSSPIRAARANAAFGIDSDATDLANISSELLEDPELSSTDNSLNPANLADVSRDLLEDSELSSTDSNENQVNLASISSDLLEDSELSSTDSNEKQLNLTSISSSLLKDPESSSTDSNENELDLAGISSDLLEDPELSSTDINENELDLAGISGDLLVDPELASANGNSLASKTKNPDDDALRAEAVPEPTTGLGALLALGGLGLLKNLKNRKNKE